MNIVIARITKNSTLFLVFVLIARILNVTTSSHIIDVLAQKIEQSEKKESVKEKCISYNKLKKLISITYKYANFADVTSEVTALIF